MKEMIYQSGRIDEILHEGNYKGFDFQIVTYGTHPCCYVEMPSDWKDNTFDDKNVQNVECHYGVTYVGNKIGKKCFGWDYAHHSDYMGYDCMFPDSYSIDSKRWSTEELFEELKEVVDNLKID